MAEPMEAEEQAQMEGAEAVQGEGAAGPDEAMQAMQKISEAMNSLGSGLEDAGAPKEALMKLKEAATAYEEFLSLLGKPEASVEGNANVPAEQMGAKGARPADMPGGPGVRPVQA